MCFTRWLAVPAVAATMAMLSAAAASAAVGDLTYFDCVGQGSIGCTDLNPVNVLDDARAVTVVGTDVYAVGEASNAISHYRRDSTGALTFANCVGQGTPGCTDLNPTATAIGGPVAVVASPDGSDVYVAGHFSDGIAHFSRTAASGDLTFADCISFNQFGCTKIFAATNALDGPSALAISPDGSDLYATSERKNAILHFTRGAGGTLSFADCIAMGATGCTDITATANALDVPLGVVVSPGAGAQVYVTAHDSAALVRFARGAGGALTFTSCLGQGTFGCTSLGAVNALYGVGAVAINAAGNGLYVVDGGIDTVAHFKRSGSGAVTFSDCAGQGAAAPCTDVNSFTGALDEPVAVAVSSNGKSVYFAAQKASTVSRFAAGAGGVLTFASCAGGGTAGCQDVFAIPGSISGPTGVAVAGNDLDVYATLLGSNALTHLRRKARPVCLDGAARTAHDQAVAVTLSCSDVDGNALTRAVVTPPASGTLGALSQATGKVTYTPAAGFAGTDTFTFRATDVDGASNIATVTVTVDPAAVAGPPAPEPPGPGPPTAGDPTPAPAPVSSPSSTPTPAPAPTAAASLAAPKFADVVPFPSARKCSSRRSFQIRLRITGTQTIESAAVFVNTKRVQVVRGTRLTAPIILTGLPRGRYTVRIVLTTTSGKQISGSRKYRTCAKKAKKTKSKVRPKA